MSPEEVKEARAYWRRRFDQGWHGHLSPPREEWVEAQLERMALERE